MEHFEKREGLSNEVLVPVPLLFMFLLHEAQEGKTKGEGSQGRGCEGSEKRVINAITMPMHNVGTTLSALDNFSFLVLK